MPLSSMIKRLQGEDGYVTVKGLGTRAGEVAQWAIYRRGMEGPDFFQLDLHVLFSFVVPSVLLDPDYNEGRDLVLKFSRTKQLRVHLDQPERMALVGKVLDMKGIEPIWDE